MSLTDYNAFVEDCKDILVEAEFNSRWALIEGYHTLGKLIVEEGKVYGDGLNARLASSLNKSVRTIEYAVTFANKFDTVDMLPEGKNVSWNQVVKKHLTTPRVHTDCSHEFIEICAKCKEKKNG
jgi:hypothetical protein